MVAYRKMQKIEDTQNMNVTHGRTDTARQHTPGYA